MMAIATQEDLEAVEIWFARFGVVFTEADDGWYWYKGTTFRTSTFAEAVGQAFIYLVAMGYADKPFGVGVSTNKDAP